MEVLSTSVLVLNKSFYAVDVINVKDAFCKVINERAEIVDGTWNTYTFHTWAELSMGQSELASGANVEWVHTPTMRIMVPRVIRTLEYDRQTKPAVLLTRRNIFWRDRNRCQYCGNNFDTAELNIDHILPQSRGGKSTWENVVCSCMVCNSKKDNRTPTEAGMKLTRQPRIPSFMPNFKIYKNIRKYDIWKNFVSEMYWNIELEKD